MRNNDKLFHTVEYDVWAVLLLLHLQQIAVYDVAGAAGVEGRSVLVYDFLYEVEHEKRISYSI